MAVARLIRSPKVARALTGKGALPNPETLLSYTPERLVNVLNRFGIEPDILAIEARADKVFARIQKLMDEKVTPTDADWAEIEKANEADLANNLRKMAKSAIRLYRLKRMQGAKFMWVAVAGGALSCPSCEPRHGQIKTIAQWRAIGLPGSAALKCGEECNCHLVAISDENSEPA